MPSTIRMPVELRNRLELAAKRLKRSTNWIINTAVDEYLLKVDQSARASKARRQSLLAKNAEQSGPTFWENAADTRGWR